MKKGRLLAHIAFLCCIVLHLSPFAYADIFDDFSCGDTGEYMNFNAVSVESLGWDGVSAATVLAQGDGNVSAALYRCTGATGVSVTLYSILPVYAARSADGVLERARGGGVRYPLRYSVSADTIYTSCGGQAYAGSYDLARGSYVFTACDALPADCVTYGVSVWYSRNGWWEAKLTLTADAVCTGCFMQRYSASIPAGATAVRVLLTEQNKVPVLGRTLRQQIRSTGSLALGSVFISGATPPGDTLPDADEDDGGFFWKLPEGGEAETEDFLEEETYDPYYDTVLPDEQTLEQMQDYREAVTEALRQPQEENAELPAPMPEEQDGKKNKARGSRAPTDEEAPPETETAAPPTRIDTGSAFWKRADVVTAGLILVVGALAAVRVLLHGKKQ